MRWDDLQLLGWIDMEQANSYIGNGLHLLEQLSQRAGVPSYENMPQFATELALANDAGYLTWTDRSSHYVGRFGPTNDPNMWLQTIDDIKLTLAGRDRALGRVIQVELPDPNEDDGRIITGLTLEEIARSIGDTYTAAQLPRYLRESGIPVDVVPPIVGGDKWRSRVRRAFHPSRGRLGGSARTSGVHRRLARWALPRPTAYCGAKAGGLFARPTGLAHP